MTGDDIEARWVMACSRRANAISTRNRALLNIEIAERNAIAAEAIVAEHDAEITKILDDKLKARLADALVDAG